MEKKGANMGPQPGLVGQLELSILLGIFSSLRGRVFLWEKGDENERKGAHGFERT
jgi:hypothetical protein